MKKRIFTISIAILVVILLAIPKLGLFDKKSSGPDNKPAGAPSLLQVQGHLLQPTNFDNTLVITGSVLANESLELKSESSGKITKINFKEGTQVRAGELLVQINDEEIRAQIEKQRYMQKLNKDNEYRQRQLFKKDAISQEEYDNALNRLNTTISDIKVLEAQLQKTRVYAPFNGTIGLRYVSNGAYITPSTVIATLYNNSPAKIEFAIPSRYSPLISTGKKIRFTIENDTSRVFDGEVYAIEPRINEETRTLKLRALADNSKGFLIPGQFVKVDLILNSKSDALLIPTQAVIPGQAGQKVFVARSGMAKEVMVETGTRTNVSIEILSGLQPGDTVITTGILQLRHELPVQVVKVN
ncbi:MAG: efflux RND transporter periplasmic adaptor subunit [Cyclobacteriaceae bacterium]|nr:efflux RND transporter periplasmic adaptor subunit [Cyclobacteriaceae bacterium]